MKEKRHFSIIIPHYKSFESIQRLIESIPPTEAEIIIVDDNSNNDKEWNNLKNKYPYCVFIDGVGINLGAGNARNRGLRIANGDWVLFADADDYFIKNAFEYLNDYVKSNFDCIYFNVTSVNLEKNEIGTRHEPYEKLVIENSNSIRYQHYVPWSKMIRRDFLIKNEIEFEEIPASNDLNFSLKVGINSVDIYCDRRVIYCVTESEGTLTKKVNYTNMESRLLAARRFNKQLRENNIFGHNIPAIKYLYYSRNIGIKNLIKLTGLLFYKV